MSVLQGEWLSFHMITHCQKQQCVLQYIVCNARIYAFSGEYTRL